ncbi:phospholipase D family protein [Chloroflexota bacterium]
MVAFLNKDRAYSAIVDIVIKAGDELVLISPYIKIPSDLLERLKYRDNKGVRTIIVCREDELKPEVKAELKQLKNLELRFDEDLHAKCFYNEGSMVITSLNLYEHSQQHNREMGILLNLNEEPDVFKEALDEAEFIVGRAKRDSTMRSFLSGIVKEAKVAIDSSPSEEPKRTKTPSRAKLSGYCIRCRKNIKLDLKAPYCPDCYSVWAKYKDTDYKEKYCHKCGKPNKATTMKRPVCVSCYRK